MLTGDLDGDGKADVVVLGRGSLRWATKLAEKPVLSSIDPIDENARSFHLFDFDGDKDLDLVCVAQGTAMNLRLRHGRGDGTFGPWHIAGIDNLHHVFPAKLADGSPALATIEGANRRVALHVFAKDAVEAAREWWALPDSQGNKALPFAVGVYLPLAVSVPIFLGGAVRYFTDRVTRRTPQEGDTSPGVLFSSGYIAGGSVAAVSGLPRSAGDHGGHLARSAEGSLDLRGRRSDRVVGGNPESFGGAHAIIIDPEFGVFIGASDPRKGGCALGF